VTVVARWIWMNNGWVEVSEERVSQVGPQSRPIDVLSAPWLAAWFDITLLIPIDVRLLQIHCPEIGSGDDDAKMHLPCNKAPPTGVKDDDAVIEPPKKRPTLE